MAHVVILPVVLHLCHGKSVTGFRKGEGGVFQIKIDVKREM